MSYVISGTRQHLGRVTSRATAADALAEVCRMERGGYEGVLVSQPFRPPMPASLFTTAQKFEPAKVCANCWATCEARAAQPRH